MTEKTAKYYVTDTAGNWVAGKRSPGFGKVIDLTEAQAATPLRNGEISKDEPGAKSVTPTKKKPAA